LFTACKAPFTLKFLSKNILASCPVVPIAIWLIALLQVTSVTDVSPTFIVLSISKETCVEEVQVALFFS
jgi:hypothetical protein